MGSRELTTISQAELALNNTNDINEIVNLRNIGRTVEVAYKAKELKEEAQQAKVFQLKAQIKAGQWLDENVQQGGHNKANSNDTSLLPEGISYDESSRWQKQYKAGMDRLEKYLESLRVIDKKTGEIIETKEASEAGFMRFIDVFKGQNTGEYEWYTPKIYIDAARRVMGSIDIDPASSETANKMVKAEKYYTIEDDGLSKAWNGNVWMNPPFATPLVTKFTSKLTEKFKTGEVKQACVLVNNSTETQWFQPMLDFASAVCFIKGRVIFLDKDLEVRPGSPLQGQALLYFGDNKQDFANEFSKLGKVLYAK